MAALDPASLFPGHTETAVLSRILDWSTTALGPIERWPEALRGVVRTCSASTFPICLWCGPALTLIYNDAYRVVLGSKHPYSLGRPGPDVWAEIWESIKPLFDRIRAGRSAVWFEDKPYQVERRGRLEDVWFTFSLSPIRDEDGMIIGFMNIVAETTERVLAQQRLEQARVQAEENAERFRTAQARAESAAARTAALQAVTAALSRSLTPSEVADVVLGYATDTLGITAGLVALLSPNGRAIELVGAQGFTAPLVERFRRMSIVDATPLAEAIRMAKPVILRTAEERDRRYPHLVSLRRESGAGAMIALPTVADGGVLGALAFNFPEGRAPDDDELSFLTAIAQQTGQALQRARLFETERALRAEAEAANRAKGDFLAVMSHELRTPLNAIAGHADLLALGVHGTITQAQLDAVERIKRSGRHLLGLINDILNYAKIEAGRLELHLSNVQADDALGRLEAIVGVQAVQRGITFSVVECPNIWIRADAEKLQQILLNLCSNALTATERGGRVQASCMVDGKYAQFAVRDTGVGIATERLEEIFEPFVQIDRGLSSPKGGTGLGLAISRDLARAMGGDITAASVPGEGSVFTVALPLSTETSS
jgi:signal transduction histidine kinase